MRGEQAASFFEKEASACHLKLLKADFHYDLSFCVDILRKNVEYFLALWFSSNLCGKIP